jgi:hypothetical protein
MVCELFRIATDVPKESLGLDALLVDDENSGLESEGVRDRELLVRK